MSYESQLKSDYATIHARLIHPIKTSPPLTVVPALPAKPPPKIEVIPNSYTRELEPPKPRYTLDLLAKWLSDFELIGVRDIKSHQRSKQIALSRMIFFHLAYKHSSGRFSSLEIGRFAHKDHTTVLSGIATIARRREKDRQLHFRLCQYENALIHQNVESGDSYKKCLCCLCPYR